MASLPAQVKPKAKLPRPFPVTYSGDKFSKDVRLASINFVCATFHDLGSLIELRDDHLDKSFAFGIELQDSITLWVLRDAAKKVPLKKADFRWIRKVAHLDLRYWLAHAVLRRNGLFQRFVDVSFTNGAASFTIAPNVFPLTWNDIFAGEEMPTPMNQHRWVNVSEKMIQVQHHFEGGGNSESHTYSMNLNSMSASLLASIELHRNFPAIVPHSHRVLQDGVEVYLRELHDNFLATQQRHEAQYQGGARWFSCRECGHPFVSFTVTQSCAACDRI